MTKSCLRFSELESEHGSFYYLLLSSIYKVRAENLTTITGESESGKRQEAFCANSVLTSSA